MKTEEKNIEEAAKKMYPELGYDDKIYCDIPLHIEQPAFIAGAKSEAAKEYHTKGMFTQQQVSIQFCNGYEAKKTEESKLYTEEDVITLGDKYEEYCINCFGNLPKSFSDWFNENKKK